MSTETNNGHADGADAQAHRKVMAATDTGSSTHWEIFFQEHGWIEGSKIHCPDELIFEMRFADGQNLVVYPASGGGDSEMAPSIVHGVLTFKNGTDHFYYPWNMLLSLVTKLNPRRSKKVQGREYAVDSGADYERRIKNSDDLVIQPNLPETPKTVVGQTVAPPQEGAIPGKRQFSGLDPNSTSWSAGGSDDKD